MLLRATLFLLAVKPCFLMRGALILSGEKKLIKDLLDTYQESGITGRPVSRTEEVITVEFGMGLIQILNLDEQNQILTVSTWNRYQWRDNLLMWNSTEYGGINHIRVPATKIWKPDIVLYNYADDRLTEHRDAMVTVSSDGSVYWIPPAIYKSSCSIDITHFPFDVQTCHFKFGSWTYDGTKVDIVFYTNNSQIDLSDFVLSNEWDIISHDATRTDKIYPCCPEHFPDLTFNLVLRRKVAFYSYILVLPCILLSVLVMVLFWIPPESAAKMQLGINIFVAFFVLLLLLANNTPSGASSIPLIGAYYCLNMVLVTFSTFLAMFVVRTYVRFDRKNKPPQWLKKIILHGVAKVLFMQAYVPGHVKHQLGANKSGSNVKPNDPAKCQNGANSTDHLQQHSTKGTEELGVPLDVDKTPDLSPVHMRHRVERDVREIRTLLKGMQTKLQEKDTSTLVLSEWRAIAMVMDRMFFILYVTVVVISVAVIFPKMASPVVK